MHCLAIYVKEGLPFAQDLSLGNSADSCLYFRVALLTQCLTSFSSINHLLCLYAWFLILFHLTQLRFPQSTVELIDLVNSFINFLSQTTFLRWLTFLLRSQTDSHSPTLLNLFIFSDASICFTMAFPTFGNFDHVVVSVSIDFPSKS